MPEEPKIIQTEEELIQHVANLPPPAEIAIEKLLKRDYLWMKRVSPDHPVKQDLEG